MAYCDFDDYDYSGWGDTSVDESGASVADFTEADGENLVKPEEEYEDDPTES
jgi:hypothetical protein